MHLKAVTLALLAVVLCGCAAATKSYTPINYCAAPVNSSMARIIVTRRHDIVARGTALKIFDDHQPIGEVGPGGKLCWDRYPGKALITASMMGSSREHWKMVVDTKPDTVYHVSVSYDGKWKIAH